MAKFARKLSQPQPQRRALGIRRHQDCYPAPSQPIFWRLLVQIDGTQLEQVLRQVQAQLRGPAPQNELIALDGKEPKHGGAQSVAGLATLTPCSWRVCSGASATASSWSGALINPIRNF